MGFGIRDGLSKHLARYNNKEHGKSRKAYFFAYMAEVDGDPQGAENFYKQSLQHNPNYLWAHARLINLYWNEGRNDLALAQARQAMLVDPDAEQGRGFTFEMRNRNVNGKNYFAYMRGLDEYERGIEKRSSGLRGTIKETMVAILIAEGKTEEAGRIIDDLEAAGDTSIDLMIRKMWILSGTKRDDEVLEYVDRHIGVVDKPARSLLLLGRASALCELHRYEEAEECLKKSSVKEMQKLKGEGIDMNDVDTLILGVKARLYRGTGRHAEAIRALEEYLKIDSRDVSVHLSLASVCLESGDGKKARSIVDRILMAEPENKEAQELREKIGGNST